MTKTHETIIIAVMILLIATFVILAVSMQSNTDKVLSVFSARREELAGRQQQIQDMILSLNSTLQSAIVQEQSLAAQAGIQMNNTSSQQVQISNQPVQTPIVQTQAIVPTPPPVPVPTPTPIVTRAS